MEKRKEKHLKWLFIFCMISSISLAQAKSGLENYSLLSRGESSVWIPVLHYQSKKGMYAEVRYNYEELNTVSLYAGKTITGGRNLQFSFTPMIGASAGEFNGFSLAANAEIDWKKFYISSQTQNSFALKDNDADFFFTWSEMACNFTENIFAGLALQYTRQDGIDDTEPGIVAGVNLRDFSIPFYAFKPFTAKKYFIIGLNYEFNFKKKK